MRSSREALEQILNNEKSRIRKSYPSNDVIFPLIEIIRSLDFETYAQRISPNQSTSALILEKYRFGWSLAFYLYYQDLLPNDNIPLFEFSQKEREWVDSIIQHCGSIQILRQYLDYEKAGLVEIIQKSEKEFLFRFLTEGIGDEIYDHISLSHYLELIQDVLKDKIKPALEQLPEMRKKLESRVRVTQERFIEYNATEEMEVFYRRLGYLILMTTQIVDDFDEADKFGGYNYKDYMDFVQDGFMAVLMHRDCCFALAEKTKYKVNLRTILTYGFSSQRFFELIKENYKWPKDKVEQIATCLAITKENYEYHLNSYPGLPPAPYYQLSNDVWMRSTEGCLKMPVFFLNREIKRRFPKDYFEAVNKREVRFRSQVYDLFKYDWIHCVNQNVFIGTTDIDAVVFDTRRKILGLFQLKWQDAFSTSMQERRNRISNMIPKSVEWIDNVERWISANDAKSLLKKCGIDGDKIEDIYLFVLSRNHVHFTNHKLDERATWGSWFQLIEASTKIKDTANTNPIGEMAAKLRFLYPDMRREVEGVMRQEKMTLKFGEYLVKIQSE